MLNCQSRQSQIPKLMYVCVHVSVGTLTSSHSNRVRSRSQLIDAVILTRWTVAKIEFVVDVLRYNL